MYLIFDAYGTLLEMDDFYGRLQAGFARLGTSLPLEVVRTAAHREMRHYMSGTRQASDLASWTKLRDECADVLANSIREQGWKLDLPTETVGQVLFDSVVYKAFPNAVQTLEELRSRGVRLAVLSNWDFRLNVALEETGLAHFFDFVLASAHTGVEKPAREFFEKGFALARRFTPQLTTSECFYIGDHYEKDVLGARNAGMNPLWLVRSARDLPSGEIHESDDLVPRLRSLKDLLRIFEDKRVAG